MAHHHTKGHSVPQTFSAKATMNGLWENSTKFIKKWRERL